MRRSSRSKSNSSFGQVPNRSKASSPFRFHSHDIKDALEREKLLEGALVPDYLHDYLATCTMAELKAYAEVYRCPQCGGELVPIGEEGEAEERSEPPRKGGAHGRH